MRDKLVSTSHNLNAFYLRICLKGFPGGSEGKTSACNKGNPSLGLEDPLEKEMTIHSSILAWRIPGRRSLVGYSSWGRKDSDMTE